MNPANTVVVQTPVARLLKQLKTRMVDIIYVLRPSLFIDLSTSLGALLSMRVYSVP